MYSGEEIVSQEECKIVLAEFYEGVDCYSEEDNSIKFTLQDWSTAVYDEVTQTLTTRWFTCRPLIITEEVRITFVAELPEDTSGLEVIMHTGDYERVRIMPLMYLPACNFLYSWDPKPMSFPIISACNTPSHTTMELIGLVSEVTSTSIIFVGSKESSIGAITARFYTEEDILMTINPSFTTELRMVNEWIIVDGEYVEVEVEKEVILISLEKAHTVKYEGFFDYEQVLYDCDITPHIGATLSVCNLTSPTYEARLTSSTEEYSNQGGWFTLGDDTKFRLLPHMSFKRKEGLEFYFKGAEQIEFVQPYVATFDIQKCYNDPTDLKPGCNGFYLSPIEYFVGIDLYLELTLGNCYTVQGNCVTELSSGDKYCFYKDKTDNPVPLSDTVDTKVIGDCHTYYKKNNGPRIETPSRGHPISDDPRVIWSQTKCKFIVTCESLGSIPCDNCLDCEDLLDGESSRLYSTNPSEVCTSSGIQEKYEWTNACSSTPVFLGSFPSLSFSFDTLPTQTLEQVEHIFFRGTSMYIVVSFLTWSYPVFIGNLGSGVQLKNIIDDATGTEKAVSFLVFLYLSVLKFPYKYVSSFGISNLAWLDDDFIPPAGVSEAGGYDFKIRVSDLVGKLEPGWQGGYDWSFACSWISAEIKRRVKAVDKIITVNNTGDIDDLACNDNSKLKYYTSNVPLKFGRGVIPPVDGFGAYQEKYDKYAEDISLFITPEAEAFAYIASIYEQNLKSF